MEHVLVQAMRAPNIDIFDPDIYVDGVPHDAFRVLRAESPVHRHAEPDGVGFWAVTKFADIMGVPQEDRHLVFDWSNRLIGFDDPEFQTTMEDAQGAAMEMWQYANQLAEGRKGQDGKDLVTVLINAEVDGEQLTEMEFD